ncbi:hypothetical protein QTP88_007516 [Uroleucon formosanum]
MEDFVKVEVTGDADAVTSELYVENTVENPALYTIEDNHVSLASENIEKVIKSETDMLDDIWRSRIEINKDVDNQSIMELPLECQVISFLNNVFFDKIFLCHICGESFVLNYLFKNHVAEHKREVHHITHECKFCGKQFKLRFGLNRHIQKNHNRMYKCGICRLSIDCSKYIEHEEYHERKDSIVSIVRATPYFCIRKLPNIKNGLSNDEYEQTSQNKLVFTCKICKSSPSTDIHSFALHMSDHSECNMNECIVCDKKFNSVVLWTAYMTNHQQQIDLNVSTVQSNLLETESNTFDPINSINMEPQVILNSISIEDNNTESATNEDIELNEYKNKPSVPVNNKNCHLNNHVNKSDHKKSTFCIFCNKHFAHLGALTNHMCIHGLMTYKCQYCSMQFSKKGLYIMHEKTHVLKNLVKSAPSQNKNNIVVKVNDESQIEHCNDFEIVHSSIDGNSSGTNLTDIEHLWFSCDVCQKKFSTPSQLIFHRKVHYGIVPYVCKICNRSNQLKFRWNCHLNEHYKRHNSNLRSKQHNNNLKSNICELNIESINPKDQIKCQKCKKEFNSISRLKNHMSMSKECRRHCRSYIPEITSNKTVLGKTYLNTCDNTGLTKNKLLDIIQQKPVIKKQNRSNRINSNKCEVCGKIYSSRSNLSCHISMIHAQTSEPLNCNVCLGTFKHRFAYREHLRTKHGQFVYKKNEYICKICKVKFADNITLQKHTEIHPLYMYKCNDCGQRFETNLYLGNHIWEDHSDK